MLSRLLRPALAAVVLLLTVPAAASAAGVALRAPADGVVTGAAVLEVRVVTEAQEVVERIEATLRPAAGESEDAVRHPLCDEADVCSRPDAVYGIEFDPHGGAPFAAETATWPNGDYVLRLHLTRTDAAGPETFDLPLILSAPGSAVADLTAAVDGRDVTLSWGAAPEPDLTGYLLERLGSDGWITLGELPAEATSSADRPPPGHQAYRVVTLRPDGRGATYETVSREVTVEVADPADPPVGGDGAGAGDDAGRDGAGEGLGVAGDDPGADRADGETTGGAGAAGPPATPPDEAAGGESEPASETPSPDTSVTDRDDGSDRPVEAADRFLTVTEEGGLVAADAGSAADATAPARYVLPLVAGLLFVALGVRTWRWSRHVAPPR